MRKPIENAIEANKLDINDTPLVSANNPEKLNDIDHRQEPLSSEDIANDVYMKNKTAEYYTKLKHIKEELIERLDVIRREAPETYKLYTESQQELNRRLKEHIVEKKCSNDKDIYSSASTQQQKAWAAEVFADFMNIEQNKQLVAYILETEDKILKGKFSELMEHYGEENMQKILSYSYEHGMKTKEGSLNDQASDTSRSRNKRDGGLTLIIIGAILAFAAEAGVSYGISKYEKYKFSEQEREALQRNNQAIWTTYKLLKSRQYVTPPNIPALTNPYHDAYHQTSNLLGELNKLGTRESVTDNDLSTLASNLIHILNSLNIADKSVLYYIARYPGEVAKNITTIKESLIEIRDSIIDPYYVSLAKALIRFKDTVNVPHKALDSKTPTDSIVDSFKASLTITFNDVEQLIQKINIDRKFSNKDIALFLDRLKKLHTAMIDFGELFRHQLDREVINEVFTKIIRDIQVNKIYGSTDINSPNFDIMAFIYRTPLPTNTRPQATEIVKPLLRNDIPSDIVRTEDNARAHGLIVNDAKNTIANLYKLSSFFFASKDNEAIISQHELAGPILEIINNRTELIKDIEKILKAYELQNNMFSKQDLLELEKKLNFFGEKTAGIIQALEDNSRYKNNNNLIKEIQALLTNLHEGITKSKTSIFGHLQKIAPVVKSSPDLQCRSQAALNAYAQEMPTNCTDQNQSLKPNQPIGDEFVPFFGRQKNGVNGGYIKKSEITPGMQWIDFMRNGEKVYGVGPEVQNSSWYNNGRGQAMPTNVVSNEQIAQNVVAQTMPAKPASYTNPSNQTPPLKPNQLIEDELVPFFGVQNNGVYGGHIKRSEITPGMQWTKFVRNGQEVYGVGPEPEPATDHTRGRGQAMPSAIINNGQASQPNHRSAFVPPSKNRLFSQYDVSNHRTGDPSWGPGHNSY